MDKQPPKVQAVSLRCIPVVAPSKLLEIYMRKYFSAMKFIELKTEKPVQATEAKS